MQYDNLNSGSVAALRQRRKKSIVLENLQQMSIAAWRVQTAATMVPRWLCVALLYSFTALFDGTGGLDTPEKRSRAVWYNAKVQ